MSVARAWHAVHVVDELLLVELVDEERRLRVYATHLVYQDTL
jgi:hypothetical protein